VGAGVLLLAALAGAFSRQLGDLGGIAAPVVGLGFTALTGVLLVWDLKRPERFLFILLKPNPTSWLFKGAVALGLYAALGAGWLLAGILHAANGTDVTTAYDWLRWPIVLAAALTAGYTAFLFGQAEGRDLWQSPLLLWHLLAQAVMTGGGALLVILPFYSLGDAEEQFVIRATLVATAAHLLFVAGEYFGRHATRGAAVAAHVATRGRYARMFWFAAVLPSVLAGGLLVGGWNGGSAATVIAGLLVQPALLAYESVFVRAGQDVPLS
jgi:formate-dependent nitrite reductase membrane component NrfD